MIRTTLSSNRRRGNRFVRAVKPGVEYAWCIQCRDDLRYDAEQGFCEPSDVPDDIRKAADDRYGFSPSYVRWPL